MQEKEAATEELASTSALLETSQKDLADAEGRCRSLEKTATEGRDAGNDKLSAMEEEASGLRKEVQGILVLFAFRALARLDYLE